MLVLRRAPGPLMEVNGDAPFLCKAAQRFTSPGNPAYAGSGRHTAERSTISPIATTICRGGT